MNAVLTPTRSSRVPLPRVGAVLLVSAIAVGSLMALTRLVRHDLSYVQIVIENPLPYLVNVEVTDSGRHGWMDLASVARERTSVVQEVADQGDEWVFRFSYGGIQAGELVMPREGLTEDGWRITVPTAVADRLHEAGLRESARQG